MLIHFWWWEYRLKTLPQWTFQEYFFVILFITMFVSNRKFHAALVILFILYELSYIWRLYDLLA